MTSEDAREQLQLRHQKWGGKWYAIEVPVLRTWLFCRTKEQVNAVATYHKLPRAIVMETTENE